MAVLFLVFPIAMGIGTFLENDYGTPAARIWIYNAWWFELIMALLLLNFLGNIYKYRLLDPKKWLTLILHLSFIFILFGAFVTRYIGYEGIMNIREGETKNTFLSEKTYLSVLMDGDYNGELKRRRIKKALELSEPTKNDFTIHTDFNQQPVVIEYLDYIKGAEEGLVPDDSGEFHLKVVEAAGGQRHDHFLKAGEVSNLHNILFALNKPTDGAINITYHEDTGKLTIQSPFEGDYMRMADQKRGQLLKDSLQVLQMRSLYQMAGGQFVFPDPVLRAKKDIISKPIKEKTDADALIVRVSTQNTSKTFKLLGGKGLSNPYTTFKVGNLEISMCFGSEELTLPFSLKLNDFIAEKYPGTESGYASFKSKVEIIEDNTPNTPYEIFMNHVLDHGGYRFFQASFDKDEKGTILSVNHDFWGTQITYLGYYLLYIGLLGILLVKGSRFKDLESKLSEIKRKKSALNISLVLAFLLFNMNTEAVYAQDSSDMHAHSTASSTTTSGGHKSAGVLQPPSKKEADSIIKANAVKVIHAEKFGRLVIQDEGGRMKPINTFSSELLRKLSKKDTYEGLTSDQVMISMLQKPYLWINVPLIYIKKENDSIRKILGTPKGEKRVALIDLFEPDGTYKLEPYLQAASSTNNPSNFDKDFIKTHEKFYLLNSALTGSMMRIFPVPNDSNNKWVSPPMLNEVKLSGMDSVYTRQILPIYKSELVKAVQSNDYSKANMYLEGMKNYQKKYGASVLPDDQKIEAEVLYNKYDIFKSLFVYYLLSGLFMLIAVIIKIFYNNKLLHYTVGLGKVLVIACFVLHTLGLILRWYVSGHAPWSDAYESMIYVAWATQFFGIALGRKSELTLAATSFVTSMVLMVAHWNWMDPAIANLQPVLNSYWLMIHVAVIVASYGPFLLGALLGALSLFLMVCTTQKNKVKLSLAIKELTIVNEMSLTIGLVMLTIGNFLGGQWANESWGRYWGWDPKETWALISIMVYAFVIHMRLVPGLRGKWIFNFASLIAIASIMMTYFGVNFYLSGLHSYASGDKAITPDFVYKAIAFALILGAVSFWRYRKHYKK